MRAAAARIEGATFESILTRAVFESPLSMKQMSQPKGGMEKFLRVDGEFLLPTVGMP